MKRLKQVIVKKQLLNVITLLLFLSQADAQINYEQALSAKEDGIGFLLSWATSDEVDNESFYIERAEDGEAFKTIGTIKSEGKKEESKYSFKDEKLGLKKVSYRIKSVASDGTSSITDPIALTKEFVSYFEVVSKKQITEEVVQVSINSVVAGDLECRISNNMGEVLLDEVKSLTSGINDYVFDLSTEEDGLYYIVFKQKNVMETATFKKGSKDKKGNVAKTKNESKGG